MNINKNQRNTNKRTDPGIRAERGYALIGLMAVMMFALILTTATAPTLKQEMQREKEEEMLWRGQQVALAIRNYRATCWPRQSISSSFSRCISCLSVGAV